MTQPTSPKPGDEPQRARPRSRARPKGEAASAPASEDQTSDASGTRPDRESLRDSFWKAGRVAFILAAVYLAVQLLLMLGGIVAAVLSVLLYVIFGGIVALVVAPLDRLLRRVMPPALAALLSLLTALVVVVGVVYAVGVPIIGQVQDLGRSLPHLEQPFKQFQQFLTAHGVNVSLGTVANVLGIQLNGASNGTALISAASITVRLLVDMIIVLVTAFWLLNDRETLRRGLLGVLPGRWRTETDFVINAFVVVFGGYLRGQLVLALVVGGLAGAGCFLIGVPFALVVGVAAGVFELIPLAGPFVGAGVGALFAFTVSPALALYTLLIFLGIHIIEGYVISPRIQGRFVRLHPLLTLLALLVGVGAGGFLGAFFAVPVASLLAAIFRAGISDLRASQPDLFAMSPQAVAARGRRRSLLAEYRVRPGAVVKRVAKRISKVLHRMRARSVVPVVIAGAALATLLIYANPGRIGASFARFNLIFLPIVLGLAIGFYVMQGVRWWTLNRALGITFPLKDTVFLTITGQATALLPLGELTRALLVSRAAKVNIGAVVATETVQELLFVFMLFVVALPTAISFRYIAIAVVVPLIFIVAIVAVLTNEKLYADVRRIFVHVPLLRRMAPTVDELHRDTRTLFRHPATYRWLPLSIAQALMAVSLLWFIAEAVAPGKLAWTSAGFVYAVTQGAAWLSFSPGGLGAVEASTAGLLVALGFSFDVATAVALLQRVADKVLNGLIGWICFWIARRRYDLTAKALFDFRMRPGSEVHAAAV